MRDRGLWGLKGLLMELHKAFTSETVGSLGPKAQCYACPQNPQPPNQQKNLQALRAETQTEIQHPKSSNPVVLSP